MLGWIINVKEIAPHIPAIDKSKRDDGTFSREDFIFNKARDRPAGELLATTGTVTMRCGYERPEAHLPGERRSA